MSGKASLEGSFLLIFFYFSGTLVKEGDRIAQLVLERVRRLVL